MANLSMIRASLLASLLLGVSGCATLVGSKSSARASKKVDGAARVPELDRLMARLSRGPLRQDEVETFFLIGEQLFIERKIELAERTYEAVFEAEPTLITGLRLNDIHIMNGHFEDAEKLVQKLRVLYPDDPEPPIALARILFAEGKKQESIRVIKDAYDSDTKSDSIAVTYVDLLLKSEKTTEAKKLLEKMVAEPAPNPFFLQKLAEIELKDKKIARARNLLDQLLRIAPENIEGWTLAGFAAMEENNNAEAERYFREAYTKQPENDVLARYYVLQLLRQDKFQEARRLLLKLEAAADADHPLDAELVFHLAYVFFQLDEYGEAKSRFLALTKMGDDTGRGIYYAGQCDEAQKDIKSAEKAYRSIPPQAEYAKQAKQRIILLMLEQGRMDEAKPEIDLIVLNEKSEEEDYRFLGMARARLKDYQKAIDIAKEGLKRFPNSAELPFLIASWMENTATPAAALAAVEENLRKHPDHAQSKNYIAYTLAEKGTRLEYALSMAQKAVAQEPKNGFFIDTLGWVYFKLGNFEQAEIQLRKAVSLEPNEPIIYEHLGEVSFARKNYTQSLKHFETAQLKFAEQSETRIQADREWRESRVRVKKRIEEIRKLIPSP